MTNPQAGVVHYIIVDGYYHSSGAYTLSITCNSCPGGRANMSAPAAAVGQGASSSGGGAGGWFSSMSAASLLAAAEGGSGAPPDATASPASPGRRLAGHPVADGCGTGGIPEDGGSPSLACSAGLTVAGELALTDSPRRGAAGQGLSGGLLAGSPSLRASSGIGGGSASSSGALVARRAADGNAPGLLPEYVAGDGGATSGAGAVALASGSEVPGTGSSPDFSITDWDSEGPITGSGLGRPSRGGAPQGGQAGGGARATTDGAQHGVSTPVTFAVDQQLEALGANRSRP